MLVSSKGLTRTIVQHNDERNVNEMNWDAKYDGAVANVSLNVNDNGKKSHNNFQLTNKNLADIFTVPSVNASLEERLLNDFQLLKNTSTNKNKRTSHKKRSTSTSSNRRKSLTSRNRNKRKRTRF